MNDEIKFSKVDESIQRGLDYYSNNIELKNAVCQIPQIGPAIDFMISSLSMKFQQKRVIDSIITLHEEMERLDTKIDKEYIKKEEFFDLFVKAFDNSVRTRHRERIRLNCKILVGAISVENISERPYAEDFLSL
jgi:hypothetical protein